MNCLIYYIIEINMNVVFIVVYKYICRVYFKNGDFLIELENFLVY